MKVAVLAGGRSSEHEISLQSACAVLNGLASAGHEVDPITIGRDGVWRELDPRDSATAEGKPIALVPGGGRSAILRVEEADDEHGDVDVVFPVLHGPYGEDGTVQGLLECAGLPYVGAGVLASALCMDKAAFKAFLASAGLSQPGYQVVTDGSWRDNGDGFRERVGSVDLPIFIKPARLGSSVGITKAESVEELDSGLEEAFAHDSKVLLEQAIEGKEVECSVIGNTELAASLPGEIRTSSDWYDYEAKYEEGGMELEVPADLPTETLEEVRELALRVFRTTGCEGLGRVDFFVTDRGEVLVSEINTMPGFTTTSVFAQLFEASGVSYVNLLDRLLQLALERHLSRQSYAH